MNNTKTIFLTGSTGFLGSNILRHAIKKEWKVFALKRTNSNLDRIQDLIENPHLTLVDTTDNLSECIENNSIDAIIHVATCYGRNGESQEQIKEANFDLPINLLKAAIKNNVPGFISADTFSNKDIGMKGKENEYVITKKALLSQGQLITKDTKTKFINLTIEQMYGPNDNPTKFTPFVVKSLLSNQPSIDFTPGEQKRDFIYVSDVANAFINSAVHLEKLDQYDALGIGTGVAIPLKNMVEKTKELISSTSELHWGAMPYRNNEIMSHAADTTNNHKINWQPKVDLEQGLQKTIDWYKKQV